jgi:hypothetical protein
MAMKLLDPDYWLFNLISLKLCNITKTSHTSQRDNYVDPKDKTSMALYFLKLDNWWVLRNNF